MSARSVLLNVLSLADLEIDVPETVPHRIEINGVAKVPYLIGTDAAGFTITDVDATNLTVTRTSSAASGDVRVYCSIPHTMDNLPPLPNSITWPFILVGGGGGGGRPTGDYAMASIADSEGAILVSGVNIASVAYDNGTGDLTITLTVSVPDIDKAIPLVSLRNENAPPNTVTVRMDTEATIVVRVLNADGTPVLTPCFVRLALVP